MKDHSHESLPSPHQSNHSKDLVAFPRFRRLFDPGSLTIAAIGAGLMGWSAQSCTTPETQPLPGRANLSLEEGKPIESAATPPGSAASNARGLAWKRIPPRNATAKSGSQFLKATQGMNSIQRENAILREITAGNMPDAMRLLQPVTVGTRINGQAVDATVWVMPDYIAIGSNRDFVRMPMTPVTAQKIADAWGLLLPTCKLVDYIYAASDLKLRPMPLPPGRQMASNDYYSQHNAVIERQLSPRMPGKSERLGKVRLIAGHKKDIVLSNRLRARHGRVAIYGWHQLSGLPIQPLSTVHDAGYADYSHGIRFMAPEMLVEGRRLPVTEVLRDPKLSKLISDEGPILVARADR